MEPTAGYVSQEFGANPQFSWQPWGHLGRDYAVVVGTDCKALADGVVRYADWSSKMPKSIADAYIQTFGSAASGIVVIIEHDGWYSMYAHLSRTDMNPGNRVKDQQVVCKSGHTGNSTGPHLHFETFTNPVWTAPFGRYDPRLQIAAENKARAARAAVAAPPLTPTQRKVLAGGVNELSAPSTQTGKVLRTFAAGAVLNFKGYVIGERVDGMNGWLVGATSGKYFHIGRFTQRDVRGLPNLTPVTVPASYRKNGPAASARRNLPYLDDTDVLSYLKPNVTYDIESWCEGDTVNGSKVWFKVKRSAGWTTASLFTSQSTTGIPKVAAPARPKPPTPPSPTPAPTPDAAKPTPAPVPPTEAAYTFKPAVPCVTAVKPAAKNKFQRGNLPKAGHGIFVHQFATAERSENAEVNRFTVKIGSLDNTFTQEDDRVASSHFAVQGLEVHQYVDIKDRAYHAGAVGNDYWGIEVYGGMDAETLDTLARLISELTELAGRPQPLRRHNEVMATDCGQEVDLGLIQALVDQELNPVQDVLPPVVVDERARLLGHLTTAADNYLEGK